MQILFCGTGWLPIVDEIRRRLPAGVEIRTRDLDRPLLAQLDDVNVILPSNGRIDAAAIAAPRDLRLVQQPAAGYEGIDLEAARARGVPVCNAPGANVGAAAELTLFMLLALARRLPAARRRFAERQIGIPVGLELAGRTLALIGEGRIGGRVRVLAEALGMTVRSVRSNATRADLRALVDGADFVSLHCPLTPATRGLVDADLLARMKPGAFLVNCARGAIVDRTALEGALAAGRLGGVGLDCFWEEPWDPADPLFARDEVVVLPHIGGSTAESFGNIAEIVAGNIRRVLAREELHHRIV